ncbi:DUF4190 domain-containing protein [Mycobacterium kansasii]
MTNGRQATAFSPADSVSSSAISGFAIAALVTSVLGLLYVSIPLGIVALYQIAHRRQQGRELAIAALVISAWWLSSLVAIAVAILLVWLTRPVRHSR